MWGCHFGLRTVPAPQFDALQGRARLLSAADSLFTSAGAFGTCDAWLMPQSILQSQQLEQDAAAALASEGADLKALLEGIAKRSVELDALTGLDDVERAGAASATAVPLTAPAIAFAFNSLCSRCRKEAAAVCLRFPGVAAQGSQASALVTRIISATGHHPASPQQCWPCCHATAGAHALTGSLATGDNPKMRRLYFIHRHCPPLPKCVCSPTAREASRTCLLAKHVMEQQARGTRAGKKKTIYCRVNFILRSRAERCECCCLRARTFVVIMAT